MPGNRLPCYLVASLALNLLPMGVKDNHTKYEPETQRWRLGTGIASAGPPFHNPQFKAKISLFFFAHNRPRTR